MKIIVISPVDINNYPSGYNCAPFLGGWRLKYWIESRSEHKVDVFNCDIQNPYKIDYQKYDLVGISSLYPTREYDLKLARFVNKNYGCEIVFGGPNPTFQEEFYHPFKVLKREGEKRLLGYLEGKKIDESLTEEEFIEATMGIDYEKIPWKKLWEKNNVPNAVRIVSMVHCPMGCAFCSSTNFIKKTKMLPVLKLIKMIKRANKLNPDKIILQGDDELVNVHALNRFRKMKDHGYVSDVPMIVQTNPIRINEEIIDLLLNLNVEMLSLGIESFNDKLLNKWNKATNSKYNEKVIKLAREKGMKIYVNIILEGDKITKDKMKELDNDYVKWGVNNKIIKLPGSEMWNV